MARGHVCHGFGRPPVEGHDGAWLLRRPTTPREPPEFTHPYPFCPSFARGLGRAVPARVGYCKRRGLRVAVSKRAGIRLPTLRFRAKIMLGFAVTLAISTAS